MKRNEMQSRYQPNSEFSGRKEHDGFVCASGTTPTGGEFCVAVKRDNGTISIRDTKDPKDTTLSFNKGEWDAFVKGIKEGEFDA
jgi:hypothetical protein